MSENPDQSSHCKEETGRQRPHQEYPVTVPPPYALVGRAKEEHDEEQKERQDEGGIVRQQQEYADPRPVRSIDERKRRKVYLSGTCQLQDRYSGAGDGRSHQHG